MWTLDPMKCTGSILNSGLTSPRFGCTCNNCEFVRHTRGYSIKPEDSELMWVSFIYIAGLHSQRLARNCLIVQKKFWNADLTYLRDWLSKYGVTL